MPVPGRSARDLYFHGTVRTPRMAEPLASTSLNLGFLTVLHEASGYLGGYLVTNQWGRPLEFRLSTAVQPNRVQQILYAGTLVPYICADLIGKTLVEKTAVPVRMVLTDTEAVLDLGLSLEVPVLWVGRDGPEGRRGGGLGVGGGEGGCVAGC